MLGPLQLLLPRVQEEAPARRKTGCKAVPKYDRQPQMPPGVLPGAHPNRLPLPATKRKRHLDCPIVPVASHLGRLGCKGATCSKAPASVMLCVPLTVCPSHLVLQSLRRPFCRRRTALVFSSVRDRNQMWPHAPTHSSATHYKPGSGFLCFPHWGSGAGDVAVIQANHLPALMALVF